MLDGFVVEFCCPFQPQRRSSAIGAEVPTTSRDERAEMADAADILIDRLAVYSSQCLLLLVVD